MAHETLPEEVRACGTSVRITGDARKFVAFAQDDGTFASGRVEGDAVVLSGFMDEAGVERDDGAALHDAVIAALS